MSSKTQITAVILTKNRVKRCFETVLHLSKALEQYSAEIFVINNGNEEISIPSEMNGNICTVFEAETNLGASARNIALKRASGRYFLVLDDDAYIENDNIAEMISLMEENRELGAVSFKVENDNGSEGCLLPTVFHGCACAFRTEALVKAGGYPEGYTYYGEEYAVAFSLYNAGYTFFLAGSPPVRHVRDSAGRDKSRIINLLVRNNTALWFKAFPVKTACTAMIDTLQRYRLVAEKEDASAGYSSALARLPGVVIGALFKRAPLSQSTFAKALLISDTRQLCTEMKRMNIRTAAICGVGKFPSLWLKEFRKCGIRIAAYLDTNRCWAEQKVKAVPVLHTDLSRLDDILPETDAVITGYSSLAETELWCKKLKEAGYSAAGDTATSSAAGNFDLLNSPKLHLFRKS